MRVAGGLALGGALALAGAPDARAAFVVDGAEYLLTIQDSGGFFHDAGATTFYASTQGQMGLGMLTAYQKSCETSCNAAYLTSATKLGDAMLDPAAHALIGSAVQQNELYFDAGGTNPIVWSQNTLFLQRLAQATGNSAYTGYLQTQLWDKLDAGTYGADPTMTNPNRYSDTTGVNAGGWVAVAQTRCDDFSPWCLAKPAVAAHLSGESGISSTFMGGILLGLESVTDPETTTFGLEVLGLAAAIWASGITGVDIDPTVGIWAAANGTSDLAATLAGLIDGSGGFPAGLYAGAPATDLEATGVALLALALTDSVGYQTEILNAVTFLQAQQAGSGCVEVDPGGAVCDPGIHGEVLQYYSEVVADDTGETPVIRPPEEIAAGFYAAPEPMTVALLGGGLLGLAALRRRRPATP